MLIFEKLFGRLAKLADLILVGFSFVWVFDVFEIYVAFVRIGMEDIVILKGVLLASKYEIDPFVDIAGDKWAFES